MASCGGALRAAARRARSRLHPGEDRSGPRAEPLRRVAVGPSPLAAVQRPAQQQRGAQEPPGALTGTRAVMLRHEAQMTAHLLAEEAAAVRRAVHVEDLRA